MSILQARAHTGSVSHSFLQHVVSTYESNVVRAVSKIQTDFRMSMVPAPSIADELAKLCRDDDTLLAQMAGGDLHPDILCTLALEVADKFARLRSEFEPDRSEIERVVGRKLAQAAYGLLSLAERIAVARSLPKPDAKELCQRKIAAKIAAQRESLSDISVPLYASPTERAANRGQNWLEQSRSDKRRKAASV